MTSEIDRLVDRDHIKLLLAVVEAKSFSGAAAKLGVSQPSISQQIKRIETLAGRTLFNRGRTGVELTSDGEAVMIYARAMLALTDDLKRHLDETAGSAKISIGMSEDFCRTALPTVLWLFMRDHPHVEVRVISGTYESLATSVEEKTIDFAVMRRSPRLAHMTPLWTDELVWVGRQDLPLPIRDPVPLVLPMAPSPVRDTLIDALRACGRTWRIPFESVSLAGIEVAMQAGLGFCGAPRSMQLYGVGPMDDASGLPKLPDVEFVLVNSGRPASDAGVAFTEVLRQAATSGFRRP